MNITLTRSVASTAPILAMHTRIEQVTSIGRVRSRPGEFVLVGHLGILVVVSLVCLGIL